MAKGKSVKARKRKNRIMSHQRPSILIAMAALLVLICVIGYSSVSLKQREKIYKTQQIELQKQLDEETARAEEIDGLEEYMQKDEYIEDVARERLGLVYPDEIVFKAE